MKSRFIHILFLITSFTIFNVFLSNAATANFQNNPSQDRDQYDFSKLNEIDIFSKVSSSDGGGWSGNGGGGEKSESNNIWFIGNEDVHYCLIKSKDFPLNDQESIQAIKNGLKKWFDFFAKYDLLNESLVGNYKNKRMNRITFSDGKNRSLAKNFILQPDCQNVRLQFLFGLESKIIKEYKKYAEDHPYGLAVREKYNHVDFSHKGIIWVDSFSKDKQEIEHIILHELGHIFGMEHNSVPVMDERLTSLVGKTKKFTSDFLGNIESDSWKYSLQDGDSIIMSSIRGMRPVNRGRQNRSTRRYQSNCPDLNFISNHNIPNPIRRALGLSRSGCHKVKIEYQEGTYPNFYRPRQRGFRRSAALSKSFTVSIEEYGSQNQFSISGLFKPTPGQKNFSKGPSVTTSGIKVLSANGHSHRNGNRGQFTYKRRLSLEKNPSLSTFTGILQDNHNTYPSKIQFNRGLVLEIFLPQVNMWWTLKTHHNSN